MKPVLKFATVIAAVVLLAAFTLFALDYYEYRKSPEYQALKQYKEWEAAYRNDPYGGSTPEETLQLFIDALKKGDIELASKYFILDEQERWGENLQTISKGKLLTEMIEDLGNRTFEKSDEETARYNLINEAGEASPLVLVKNVNGRWKIRTL